MSESSNATGTVGSKAVAFLGLHALAIVLITFGGLVRSLTFVGIGTVVLFGTLGWAEISRQTNSNVFITLLPWIAAIYIVTAGLYLDSDLLWWAGFLLLISYMGWTNRSEFKRFIVRFDGENHD